MTREEAIKILKQIQRLYGGLYAASELKETYNAFDMAIESLSAEQKEEELANDIARRMATIIENEQDMRVILKNESAEPTDLISRADVKAEATKFFGHWVVFENRIDNLPSVPLAETLTDQQKHQLSEETPTNEPTDLISRADAIDAVCNDWCYVTYENCPHSGDGYRTDGCDSVEAIKQLPSAEQVTSKLKKPCDSLLTDDLGECKEQKSKLDHGKEWIIGCIKHDGFIKTDRFDKANRIILEALSAEAKTKCVAQIKVDTEEVARRIKEEYDITDGWIPCSEKLPKTGDSVLVTYSDGEVAIIWSARPKAWVRYIESNNLIYPIAWMLLPKPYKGAVK